MSMQTELFIFERVTEARGRLLRVEADRSDAAPKQLVLTFDVGHVLIRPTDEGLSTAHIVDRAGVPDGLVLLDEEEPWWRLLGEPLTAAWPGGLEGAAGALSSGPLLALKLRFRDESENPRIVLLESAGTVVRVSFGG